MGRAAAGRGRGTARTPAVTCEGPSVSSPGYGARLGASHGDQPGNQPSRPRERRATRARETSPRRPQPAKAPGGEPARRARRRPVRTGPGRLGPRRAPRRLMFTQKVPRDRKRASLAAPRARVASSVGAAKSRPGGPRAASPRSTRGWGLGRLVCAVSGRQDACAAAFGAFPIFAAGSRTGGLI